MSSFAMNGYLWYVEFVDSYDDVLIDRTGTLRVATTDPNTHRVYLSDDLYGDFLIRVLVHELGHCTMISYNLLDDIHRMVQPEYWLEAEEWICNFIADYGLQLFRIAYTSLGPDAWRYIPYELENLLA